MNREAIAAGVAERLGRDPFLPEEKADFVLSVVEVPAAGGGRHARLERIDRTRRVLGVRNIDAATCEDLVHTTAFVVVILLAPDLEPSAPPDPALGVGEPVAEPRADERQRPPRAPSPAPMTRRPASPPPRRGGVSLYVGAAAAVSYGLLPKPVLGPAVTLGIALRSLPVSFEWRGLYQPAATVEAEGERPFSAVEQQWRACAHARRAIFLGAACAGVSWMSILPSTRSPLEGGNRSQASLVGPVVALRPMLALDPVVLFAEASAALLRPRYAFSYRDALGNPEPLYEVAAFGTSLAVGVAMTF